MVHQKKPFRELYEKVLSELDALHQGAYNAADAQQTAALCLIAEDALIRLSGEADVKSRGLKRDVEFSKAEASSRIREERAEKNMKITESALSQLVTLDSQVHGLQDEYHHAEKEAKQLSNVLGLLKDAHITFRGFAKKAD